MFSGAVTDLVQWFNLIEQIHLLQMAELKLLEVIWADSIEREKSLNFYCGKCAIHRSSFQSSSMKRSCSVKFRESPFFPKWLYKIRVMIYRISLCLNWFELARPALDKCLDLLIWKTGMGDGSSGIFVSISDFHSQQRLLSEKSVVGSGVTWTLISLPKESEFP